MSIRRLLFVFIALILSGVTVLAGRAWLHGARPIETAAAPEPTPQKPVPMVLVAKGNLAAGQMLRPENLRWQPWPEEGVAENYINQNAHHSEEYIGAVVRNAMMDGEPMTDSRVLKPGERGFMAAVLEPGMRAITVPVTVSSGLAGFVFPGDRVDLILTFTVKQSAAAQNGGGGGGGGGGEDHRASETMLSDIRVLGIDQRADDQNKEIVVAKTATLQVTPKQAEVINVAQAFGQISLSLRSLVADPSTTVTPLSHTWDNEAARLLSAPISAASTVKISVVRAGKVDQIELPRSTR